MWIYLDLGRISLPGIYSFFFLQGCKNTYLNNVLLGGSPSPSYSVVRPEQGEFLFNVSVGTWLNPTNRGIAGRWCGAWRSWTSPRRRTRAAPGRTGASASWKCTTRRWPKKRWPFSQHLAWSSAACVHHLLQFSVPLLTHKF